MADLEFFLKNVLVIAAIWKRMNSYSKQPVQHYV